MCDGDLEQRVLGPLRAPFPLHAPMI
jgi:hypothetical protein